MTTIRQTVLNLTQRGFLVQVLTPKDFYSFPCPTYPEITLALTTPARLAKKITEFAPHAIHISTEGPLGWAARSVCKKRRFPFTTSYHTKFPEYLRLRLPIPLKLSYAVVRKFHGLASTTMVATKELQTELRQRKFKNTSLWTRGVDTDLFRPRKDKYLQEKKSIFMYVGRVAIEKNIESFLQLDLPGIKYVVGDGPAKNELEKKYSDAVFVGYQKGEALAQHISSADVFVFPSKTDTFGLVMLEAMASGVPVAAYPVVGPAQVVNHGVTGYLDNDLHLACLSALKLSREKCRSHAKEFSWQKCTDQFLNNLVISNKHFN